MTQLTLPQTSGRTLRDEGLALVEANAGAFAPVLRHLAQRIAEERGSVSIDDLRPLAEEIGLVPHHQNCWGAIFRAEGWHCVGFRPSIYPSNHARYIRIWTYHPNNEEAL